VTGGETGGETGPTRASGLELGRLVLLSLALSVASLLFLPFYGAMLIVLPLPSLYASAKHGAVTGSIVAVSTGVPLAILVPPLAVPVVAATLMLGVGQAALSAAGIKASHMVTLCIALFLALALLAAGAAFATKAVTVQSLQQVAESFEREAVRYWGVAPASPEAGTSLRELYVYMLPAGLAVLSLAAGLASFLISQQVLRRAKLPSVALPPFRDWQMPWYLAWGFLLGLACVVAYRYVPGRYQEPTLYGGLNLMVVFGTLFMVQGLAVVVSWLDRFRVNPVLRAPLLLLAGVLQGFTQLLSWIGLLDVWFNFRKLKREV